MDQDMRNNLARNIKKLREARALRREELSLLLGFDNSYISKIEKARLNATIDKLAKIADYFEIKIAELFEE
jgi:transcriptional regulator with XRE-family HTH domain